MGIFNFDVTNATFITKERYTDKKIQELILRSPTLGLIPKAEEYGGTSYIGALEYAPMASISVLDTTAFTTGGPSQFTQWNCPWNALFGSANVTGFAIDATNGDENALVQVITQQVDTLYKGMGVGLAGALWGQGGGSIGKLTSGTVGGTGPFGLSIPSQITNFYSGMILNASSTNGTTGSVRTGSVTIQAVDVNAGTFTLTANGTSGIAALANTDYLFPQGAFGSFLSFSIPNWIPTAANRPISSDSFNGVNRFTTDPTRTAGVYYTGNGADKAESLIELLILINRMDGHPTHVFINNLDFADVLKGLTARVDYTTVEAFKNPQIGFDAVKVVTPAGMVNLIQDPFVPQGSAWALNLSEWLLPSMGPVPKVAEVDGLTWARQSGVDAYQYRLVARFTSYCSAPGHQGVVTF
jgi:hypothetical protein